MRSLSNSFGQWWETTLLLRQQLWLDRLLLLLLLLLVVVLVVLVVLVLVVVEEEILYPLGAIIFRSMLVFGGNKSGKVSVAGCHLTSYQLPCRIHCGDAASRLPTIPFVSKRDCYSFFLQIRSHSQFISKTSISESWLVQNQLVSTLRTHRS